MACMFEYNALLTEEYLYFIHQFMYAADVYVTLEKWTRCASINFRLKSVYTKRNVWACFLIYVHAFEERDYLMIY